MNEVIRPETRLLTQSVFAKLKVGDFFKASFNGAWHLKTSRSTAVFKYHGSQYECRFADSEIILTENCEAKTA